MKDLYEGTLFSAIRPRLFLDCWNCPIADARIEAERTVSLAKHGRLDTHEITIECYGDFGHDKVMWARHNGMRYPKEDKLGFRVEGITLTGGDFVDCPGLRS